MPAAAHYIANGAREGRDPDSFSAYHYLHNYADLEAAFGNNVAAATSHYITNGRFEGRTDAAVDAWAGGLQDHAARRFDHARAYRRSRPEGYRGPLVRPVRTTLAKTIDFVGQFSLGDFPDPDHQGDSGLTATELGTISQQACHRSSTARKSCCS